MALDIRSGWRCYNKPPRRRAAAPPVVSFFILLAPLRLVKDIVQSVWSFLADYRAWRLLRDGLNRQIKEHYERKGIPYRNAEDGSVQLWWPK